MAGRTLKNYKNRGMDDKHPAEWTDDEVRAYLLAEVGPPESWRVWRTLYGTAGAAWADDWDERSDRVVEYLHKIGAPSMLP
jgi:hypothetical protein